jgi:hypothetical protein
MTKRTDAARFQNLVNASRGEVTKYADEVLAQLYEGILKLPPMALADGTTARVEAYYPPQVDEDGEHHCGIDVRLSSGDLLEFTIRTRVGSGHWSPRALGLSEWRRFKTSRRSAAFSPSSIEQAC